MGLIQHRVLVATKEIEIDEFQKVGVHIGQNVDPRFLELIQFGEGMVNESRTITMIPDGSKEGWAISDEADRIRNWLAEYLIGQQWDVVIVAFGEQGPWIEIPKPLLNTVSITQEKFVELTVTNERMRRLEAGGVDNWGNYGDSLHGMGEEPMEDFENRIKAELK